MPPRKVEGLIPGPPRCYSNPMPPIAMVSDIHANIEAYDVVLQDIDRRGIQEIYCLGDVIGYGPSPRECLLRTADRAQFILRGNHEDALLFLAADFNPEASQAIDWTRQQMNDKAKPKEENHKLWNILDKFAEKKQVGDILYVHASPRQPTKEYVRPVDAQDHEKMKAIFDMIQRLCFCGHTHEPGVFTENFRFIPPRAFDQRFKLPPGQKFVINVGSVGQPRDRDNRACYITFDGEVVEFHRLEYDFRKTMKKILDTNVLSKRFAERLELGR